MYTCVRGTLLDTAKSGGIYQYVYEYIYIFSRSEQEALAARVPFSRGSENSSDMCVRTRIFGAPDRLLIINYNIRIRDLARVHRNYDGWWRRHEKSGSPSSWAEMKYLAIRTRNAPTTVSHVFCTAHENTSTTRAPIRFFVFFM
jgi:hypothetical protein